MNDREKEFNYLQENNFLSKYDKLTDILDDHGTSNFWAEGFWRRRHQHANRPDPEVEIIARLKPKSLLEIGCGYGRFLNKLQQMFLTEHHHCDLFGVEQCNYLKKHKDQFLLENEKLNEVNFVFDDFFDSIVLEKKKFDIIVLPMNTFYSFDQEMLQRLFSRVKILLNEGGKFIFSSHKIPEDKPIEKLVAESLVGELLPERGLSTISLEAFRLEAIVDKKEATTVSYFLYHRLSREYNVEERKIFRIKNYYRLKGQVEELIKENNFSVVEIDDKSHSFVFITGPIT